MSPILLLAAVLRGSFDEAHDFVTRLMHGRQPFALGLERNLIKTLKGVRPREGLACDVN